VSNESTPASLSCRFFERKEDWQRESALYKHDQIRNTLPPVHGGTDNADGTVRSPSGFPYPPYLVMERGAPLNEWLHQKRSGPAVLNMFFDVAAQLTRLHSAGHVHRDLKPGAQLNAARIACSSMSLLAVRRPKVDQT
jgi:hypothetical protein